ncbi:glycosyltransferase [Streptomyces sp. NPDC058373]|uniref:glycosyltransferase n=1 Tax=unclassified Streptomyces TaxID=2593676 RepID=UPI0036602E76
MGACVDVLTPVHSSYAPFLAAAWHSLLSQTHPGWSWLVQIDGEPASVTAALESCGAAADPRVKIAAHGTKEGPAVTRNIGLGRATAPFVQNMDADDALEPGALTALAAALTHHRRAGYAVGRARDLMPDGRLVDPPLPLPPGVLPRGAVLSAWQAPGEAPRLPVHPAGIMWRRPLLLTLGGWSALQGMEDTGLLLAASALTEGVLIEQPTLRYRRHSGQHSRHAAAFAGRGMQIAMVRERAALLAAAPAWSAES